MRTISAMSVPLIFSLLACAAAAEPPVFYQSPEFTVRADSVERDGKRAFVDPATGAITSETHFRMTDRGDRHVPKERMTRPATWQSERDLSPYPVLKSGYPAIDAVYRLCIDKVIEHRDYEPVGLLNASEGRPPWVRDTSYVVLMGCDALFPEASRKTLEWSVNKGETIKPEQLDGMFENLSSATISQNPYYRMGDFVIWIPAVWQYARTTGDRAFIGRYYTEMANSLELAREVLFDPWDGLYDGGDTIGDGFSMYPENSTGMVMLKGASVNFIHYKALLSMAEMAEWLGKPAGEADAFRARAFALKDSINRELWLEEKGYFSLLRAGRDPQPVERATLAGNAFALLWNGTDNARKASILKNQPDTPWGAPLVWPAWMARGAYHDQNIWPVIEGLWGTAAAQAGSPDRTVKSLALLTANGLFSLNLSEMWSAFDGKYKGKEPQLWSCTAYLMEIFQGLLGLQSEVQGLLVQPSVPAPFASGFEVSNYRYRDAVYTFKVKGQGSRIASFKINGKPELNLLPPGATGAQLVEIEMTTELPFGFGTLPETIALEDVTRIELPILGKGNLKVLGLAGATAGPVVLPVKDGRAKLDSDCKAGVLRLCVAEFNPAGAPVGMTPWQTVDIRPALALHCAPGVVESACPLAPGAAGSLNLVVRNFSSAPLKTTVNVTGPAELVFASNGRKIEIPAGGSLTVPLDWKCTGKLGYGTYPVAVSVGSSSVEMPVRVAEAIDLRCTWVMKALPDGEDGSGFGVYDRDGNWDYARMPGRWQNIKGFETYTGTVWFRKYVLAPSAWAGHDAVLNLGEVSGKAKVFVNEIEVEKLPSRKSTSLYNVPAKVLRAGDNNLIAVRMENNGPKSGLTGWPMELRVLSATKTTNP